MGKKNSYGYIYEAMEKANEIIVKSFNEDESKYNDRLIIIDNRWTCQLHRPLHVIGHFLNPELFIPTQTSNMIWKLQIDYMIASGG